MEYVPQELLDATLGDVVIVIGLIVSLFVLLRWIKKNIHPAIKGVTTFLEDWNGEPARPGIPRKPGVQERIANLEREFKPNSGSSMHDKVNTVADSQIVVAAILKELAKKVGITNELVKNGENDE